MVKKSWLVLCACLCSIALYAQPYNFYYGNIHSHTGYSDGNQDVAISGYSTPAQDFSYAKTSFHTDFLGISDHNHIQAGMGVNQQQWDISRVTPGVYFLVLQQPGKRLLETKFVKQ